MPPSLGPQNVREDVWYYEEKGCLDFVVQVPGHSTIQFRVPLRMIERSLARIKEPKKGRPRKQS